MTPSTYHTHTTFCDGSNTPEEMICSAIERGMREIGLSGHSYIPGEDWCMSETGTAEYIKTAKKLQKAYEKKIKVYIGVEQDAQSTTPIDLYDYVIGSCHSVFKNGKYEAIDLSLDNFVRVVNDCYCGDVYALCEDYYDTVSKIYDITRCDIIGHFDLVTKYIDRFPFDTSHPRYVAAYTMALDKLLATPAVFEVNTGAMSRGYRTTPYPSDEILDRIISSGKGIVVNSDSHSKQTIDFMLSKTIEMLVARGAHVLTTMEDILKITRK